MKIYKYFPPPSPKYPHFISSLQIRFTQPVDLNDPYECNPHIDNYCDINFIASYFRSLAQPEIDKIHTYSSNSKERKEKLKMLNKKVEKGIRKYRNNPKKIKELAEKSLKDVLNNNIGILSLSERRDSTAMWAHYTHKHKGLTVSFDSENDFFKQKESDKSDIGILKKVFYENSRISLDLQGLISHKEKISKDIYYIKSKDWSYEEEWRILRDLACADKRIDGQPCPICLFNVPPSAILEVCLGMNMQKNDGTDILHSIQSNASLSHVKIFRAALNDKHFTMDWIPLHGESKSLPLWLRTH